MKIFVVELLKKNGKPYKHRRLYRMMGRHAEVMAYIISANNSGSLRRFMRDHDQPWVIREVVLKEEKERAIVS